VTPSEITPAPTRTALFLAYYFPPLGGGGVQRSLAFARYLPEFGYRPIVVTGPALGEVQWGPVDSTLAERVPSEIEVVRVRGPEPGRTSGWRCRAERWLRLEEPFSRWWVDEVIAAAGDYVQSVDLIYASMSPFETGEAAGRLAEAAGKPWVADLRDPWALDDWLVHPTRLHRLLELRAMRRTLADAAAIVMNTAESAAELRRRAPELRDTPIFTITNGFDEAEFREAAPAATARSSFRIVHAGHVHTGSESKATRLGRRVLGGAAQGLNTRARSHLHLVEAIELLLRRRPDLQGRLELQLAGPMSSRDVAELPGFARSLGYLSHAETIRLLRSADLLFLPMHDLAPGIRARIVPGKTYEYLAAGPPILGAVPDGDARELLERAGNADVCRPTDSVAMSHAIERRADAADAGEAVTPTRAEVLQPFERRELTRALGAVFDQAVQTRRSIAQPSAGPADRIRLAPTTTSEVAP
jgi:glycosyltransferase involved in cell wall biosynthesis